MNLGADTAFCGGVRDLALQGDTGRGAGLTYQWAGALSDSVSAPGSPRITLTVSLPDTAPRPITRDLILIVRDTASGCTGRDTVRMTLRPAARALAPVDTGACAGLALTLQGGRTGLTGQRLTWRLDPSPRPPLPPLPPGSRVPDDSTGRLDLILPPRPGAAPDTALTLLLLADRYGCRDTARTRVTVFAPPAPGLAILGPAGVCPGGLRRYVARTGAADTDTTAQSLLPDRLEWLLLEGEATGSAFDPPTLPNPPPFEGRQRTVRWGTTGGRLGLVRLTPRGCRSDTALLIAEPRTELPLTLTAPPDAVTGLCLDRALAPWPQPGGPDGPGIPLTLTGTAPGLNLEAGLIRPTAGQVRVLSSDGPLRVDIRPEFTDTTVAIWARVFETTALATCQGTDTVRLRLWPLPDTTGVLADPTRVFCPGDRVTVSAPPVGSQWWLTEGSLTSLPAGLAPESGTPSGPLTADSLEAGVYPLVVGLRTLRGGCEARWRGQVSVASRPAALIAGPTTITAALLRQTAGAGGLLYQAQPMVTGAGTGVPVADTGAYRYTWTLIAPEGGTHDPMASTSLTEVGERAEGARVVLSAAARPFGLQLVIEDERGCRGSARTAIIYGARQLIPNIVTVGQPFRLEDLTLLYPTLARADGPGVRLQVYNRWGRLVETVTDAGAIERGCLQELPVGNYYLELSLPDQPPYRGWLEVAR